MGRWLIITPGVMEGILDQSGGFRFRGLNKKTP
jgi:hypothetical protein